MPDIINRQMANIFGYLASKFSNKTKKTIKTNLMLCYPELNSTDLAELTNANLKQSIKLLFEFPVNWLANDQKVHQSFNTVFNKELVDKLLENNKPVILAVPHIGNWELFWCWVQINYPSFGMYSPAKLPKMDKMMSKSRQRFGGQAFATDPKGILSLIRRLKQGGVMMILTDQVPKAGSGVYAPFFGQQAYTMTLLYKFIQKTNAELLFGCCLRNENNKDFNINIFKPSFDSKVNDVSEFNVGMNKQIEEIIQLAPDQYQWSYKRFKNQKDGQNYYKKQR